MDPIDQFESPLIARTTLRASKKKVNFREAPRLSFNQGQSDDPCFNFFGRRDF